MAISKEKKELLVSEYSQRLERSQGLIFAEYRGLSVKQMEALRRELRGCDSELVVGKNTLLARAMHEVGMASPEALLTGPTAVTFCFGEVAQPAKVITKWAKDTKILAVRGGMLGDMVFAADGVEALSTLPGRDQLRAQVVGVLQAPIGGLVNVLAGPLRGFMTVLNGRIGQLEQAA